MESSTVEMLCELHNRMINAVPSAEIKDESNPIVSDSKVRPHCATTSRQLATAFTPRALAPSASPRSGSYLTSSRRNSHFRTCTYHTH